MKKLIFSLLFIAFYTIVFAQAPVNDDLQNATILDINPGLTPTKYKNGTLSGANFSSIVTPCGLSGSKDVFYRFKAKNQRHILHFVHDFNTTATVMDSLLNDVECINSTDSLFILSNLAIGKTYFVKVAADQENDFKIGVTTPPDAPINDKCSTATTVVPSNDWSCKYPVSGSTYYAAASVTKEKYDVWYTFTATSEKHVVYLENVVGIQSNNIQIELAVKKGTCGQDSTVYVSNTPNNLTKVIGNLTIGQKYLISISALNQQSFFFFDLCVLTPTAQNPNDDCTKAEAIQISPNEQVLYATQGTTGYKLYSDVDNVSIPSSESVWYKFTASTKKHQILFYNIKSTISASASNLVLNIFDQQCNALAPIETIFGEGDKILNTIIGKTYYIQVTNQFNDQRAKFKISIITVPILVNDDCDGAIAVQISKNTKPTLSQVVDFHWATDANQNYTMPDLWYSFVAEKTTHTIQTTSLSSSAKPYIEVFTGDCSNYTTFQTLFQTTDTLQLIGDLVVGQKYLIKLTYQINLGLCVCKNIIAIGTPPVFVSNDNFADAKSITPSPLNACQFNKFNLTWASVQKNEDICSNQTRNIWYKFVAQKDKYLIDVDTVNSFLSFLVFYKNANDSLQVQNGECINFFDFGEKSSKRWINNLVIGRTYWILAFSDYKNDFKFCLNEGPANPLNDEFVNAISLPINKGFDNCVQKTAASIKFASPSLSGVFTTCGEDIADVWYKFKAQNTSQYKVQLSFPSNSKDTSLFVNFYKYDSLSQTIGAYGCPIIKENQLSATAGETYFVRISQKSLLDKKIDFNICLSEKILPLPLANDECINAIPLTIQDFNVCNGNTYLFDNATISSDSSNCFFNQDDTWFSFVASDSTLRLYYKINQSFGNLHLELFKGDNCTSKKFVRCIFDPNLMDHLEIGKKYYLRLVNPSWSTNFSYQFCIQKLNTTAPTNDICTTAINVPVNTEKEIINPFLGNNYFAKTETSPLIDTLCGGSNGIFNDVWYKFTATASSHFIGLYNKTPLLKPQPSATYKIWLQAYSGNCKSGLNGLQCNPSQQFNTLTYNLDNLTIGETYYLRLVSNDDTDYFSYQIAILEKTTNNNCSNPTDIQYDTPYKGNTVTPLTYAPWLPDNSFPKRNLCWYRFTALENDAVVSVDTTISIDSYGSFMSFVILKQPCSNFNQPIINETYVNTNGKMPVLIKNLQKDSSYYLVFYSLEKNTSTFRFTLEHSTKVANNDSCKNALPMTVSANMTVNTFLNDNIDARFSQFQKSKYYSFVATAKNHILYQKRATSNITSFPYTLKSDCDTIKSFISSISDSFNILPDLNIGHTYYIEVQGIAQYNSKYSLAILTPPAPPLNDVCSGAINLDAATTAALVCSNPIAVQLKNATPDTLFSTITAPDLTHQWFSFTAKAINQRLKIGNFVANFAFANSFFDFQLVESNNCAQFKVLKSIAYGPSNSNDFPVILNNLTIGKKYYIAIAEGDWRTDAQFDLCLVGLPKNPDNDLCQNAKNLTPVATVSSNNTVNGTLKNAFIEKQVPNFTSDKDVWYSFTATAEFHQLYVEKNIFTPMIAEFKTASCDSLGFNWYLTNQYTAFDNLTIGQKYYVGLKTIYEDTTQNLDFKIAIVAPNVVSQNTKCSKSITLPISATTKVQQYINSDFQYNSVLWYKFVATAKSHRIHFVTLNPYLKDYPDTQTVKALFSHKSSCTAIDTSLGFDAAEHFLPNLIDTLSNNNVVTNLEIGTTYYLQILRESNAIDNVPLPFKIGVSTTNAPLNTKCYSAKALPINADKNFVTAYNENSQNLYFYDLGFKSERELWYSFTATAKRHQVVFKDLTTDADYYATIRYNVFDENCQKIYIASPVKSGFFPNFNADNEIINNLIIGKKYYVRCGIEKQRNIYTGEKIPNIDMTYKIGVVTHPDSPINDNCDNAKMAVVNDTPICQDVTKGTTFNATGDINISCNQESADDNVWYKFVATSDLHFIQLKNIKPIVGNVVEMEFALYKSDVCNQTSQSLIGCSSDRAYPLAPWKLEKGKTYFISVYTRYLNAFSQCDFDLCISTPIANDDVKGAIFVKNGLKTTTSSAAFKGAACANPMTASSIGATYSFDAGMPVGACNIGALPKDIWFKTVVGSKRNLAVQVLQSPTGASVQMVAYKLSNGALTLIPSRCPADTLLNLTQGDTIALRVWDANGTAFGNYTLCIEGFEQTTATKNVICAPVTIHPVPTSDYLNFSVAHLSEPTFSIKITNMNGTQLLQQTINKSDINNDFHSIDVRSLPPGTYILTIKDGVNVYSKKFLKI